MTSLKILSGGAAQGLVASLAPQFKEQTGLAIEGEFGAVGAMAGKLRDGTPADIVVLTAAMIADLAKQTLVISDSISDIGLVETAVAVRAGDPRVSVPDAASLREVLLGADAIFVPDTRASTAGTHVAKVLHPVD
jgi:molybdate transport system substrate-binding protein